MCAYNAPPKKQDINKEGQYAFRWWAIVLSASWAFCAAWYLATPAPEKVEQFYTRGIYRVIAAGVTSLTGAIPFSIFFTAVAVAIPAFIIAWGWKWHYHRRRMGHSHLKGFLWGPKWAILFLSLAMLWFLVFWGMGYQRPPIESRLQFDTSEVQASEVAHIQEEMLAIILRDLPVSREDRDINRAIAAVSLAMESMISRWDERPIRLPRRVKATPPGLLLSNGTSGICIPFTLEAHVDGALPDTAFVAVAAHELGHIAGLCDEGETTLAGYVAGLQAEDAYARYAVALDIYKDIASRLGREGYEAAINALPETAQIDVQRAREAGRKYRIEWFHRWAWRAYDQYLKSQGVKEGVKSYGRSVQLLTYAWRAGYLPVERNTEATPADLAKPYDSVSLE